MSQTLVQNGDEGDKHYAHELDANQIVQFHIRTEESYRIVRVRYIEVKPPHVRRPLK